MKILKIEIESADINELIQYLEEIVESITKGNLTGYGWDISEK